MSALQSMTLLEWAQSILLIVNLTVLLWSVITAFWSISRTMNRAQTVWDESERALFRLRKALDQIDGGAEKRKSE